MKKLLAVILSVILLVSFVSCSGKPQGSSSALAGTESDAVSSEAPKFAKDPLTGEYTLDFSAENKRPVAVMINNIKVSLPQKGLAEAGIIYEADAEAGITRILAVFSDVNKIPTLGSLRSARKYYLSLASSHNAIFAHFGGEGDALNYIKQNNLNTLNFLALSSTRDPKNNPNSTSYRDPERIGKVPYEHTAFTSGHRLQRAIEYKKIKTDANINDAYKFGDNSKVMAMGNAADKIKFGFSSYNSNVVFDYNATTGKYEKSQFNQNHIDANTGETLAFENVIILNAKFSLMYPGTKYKYQNVDLTSGSGYYANNGKIIPISWSKGGMNDEMKYTTTDGKELIVSPGKTYVGIIDIDRDVTYSAAQTVSSTTK